MKTLLMILLVLPTFSFAKEVFNIADLVQMGSQIEDEKTGAILLHHCQKKNTKNQCVQIIHLLKTEDEYVVLYNKKGQKIVQDMELLEIELNQTVRSLEVFDSKYPRRAGDFTGSITMMCAFDPRTCAILLLLPVTIAADLVMLPVDMTINNYNRFKKKKNVELFYSTIQSDQEVIVLKHRTFKSFLKGLATID